MLEYGKFIMSLPVYTLNDDNAARALKACAVYAKSIGIEDYFGFYFRDNFEADHKQTRAKIELLELCPPDILPTESDSIRRALRFNLAYHNHLEELKRECSFNQLELVNLIQAINVTHRRYWQMVLQTQASSSFDRRLALKFLQENEYLEPCPFQFFSELE